MNLREYISANIGDDGDYRDIAARLAREVPEADRVRYLTESMAPLVADVFSRKLRAAQDAASRGGGDVEEPFYPRNPERSRDSASPSTGKRNARHRQWWTTLLSQRAHSADGGIKLVAELTAEDLVFNIERREQMARNNVARAEQFRALLKLLEETNAATVGDITNVPSRL